ncbi:MAG: phenylacetate--CoA ligase family protein [Planctomycetota bacterium]|jgi:phenylacetate-CoA ligase
MYDIESIRKRQVQSLRSLCREQIPSNAFYAQKLQESGLNFDTMTLEDFSNKMPFTARAEWTKDQIDNPPFGTNLTCSADCYSRFCRTSGSTGKPMIWLDTKESWSAMLDCWDRVFKAAGLVESTRIFFSFSFGPFLGFWTAFESAARMGHMSIPGGGLSTTARLRALVDTQAEVLCCTPTYAIRMAHVAEKEGIDLSETNVRLVIVAGEPGGSIPATREHISEHWCGARVFDHHGMTEVGPVTYECPSEPGVLHVIEDNYYAEVIDDELILTTIKRPGSPLIRYKTGDSVSAERRTPCSCGTEELSLLGGILGRKDDMTIIRGVNIFPTAVEEIVRSTKGIVEYRVELFTRNDMAQMKVIIEGQGGETMRRELEQQFQKVLFLRIPVEMVASGTLPRYEMKAKRWVRLSEDKGNQS